MGRGGSCKECCCQSPVAIIGVLAICSFISIVLGGVVLGRRFTTNPTPEELFNGSLIGGIVAVSVIGVVVAVFYLLLSCWRYHRKQKSNAALDNAGVVQIVTTEDDDAEGGNDFSEVLKDTEEW